MSTLGPEEGYLPLVAVAAWQEPELSTAWHEFLTLLDAARAAATEEGLRRAVDLVQLMNRLYAAGYTLRTDGKIVSASRA